MDDAERLEQIQALLDELNDMSGTHIILVEGLKDVASLRHVGVDGEFFCVQSGGGPVKAAEHVWHSGKQAVIMTDWDRRGGALARALRDNLSALDVRYRRQDPRGAGGAVPALREGRGVGRRRGAPAAEVLRDVPMRDMTILMSATRIDMG